MLSPKKTSLFLILFHLLKKACFFILEEEDTRLCSVDTSGHDEAQYLLSSKLSTVLFIAI